ncbi:MAG: glycosyltransferase family 4 protein [Candidatus Taylorbacteria bacterium]|nr:glycosyltransferase family 4 protein [Candidatus Taylorbacteria bacterium]
MKILWFTWKDMEHPFAGGAEVVNELLAEQMVKDGHEVIFLVGDFGNPKTPNHRTEVTRKGFRVIRLGNQWTLYARAMMYYFTHLRDWPDLIIDESNAVPFFVRFYAKQRSIYFIHQLSRKVWFYQMFFPVHILGYLLEPIYVWLMRKSLTVTISESTKKDLLRFGFKKDNVHVLTQCTEILPVKSLDVVVKRRNPTMLSLGTIRPMKRTHLVIQAFEEAKKKIPNLELIVCGMAVGLYGEYIFKLINNSPYKDSITYKGKVTEEEKVRYMAESHVICVSSIKEGWGLIVTEAALNGTPAVVYNVDGLRDSVIDGVTGLLTTENTPKGMADSVARLLSDDKIYRSMQVKGLEYARKFTPENMYKDFKKYAGI